METIADLAGALPTGEPASPTKEELLSKLDAAHFASPDSLRTALAEEGILNPSKSLMKYLADGKQIFKCCKCVVVCDDEEEFIEHLDKEDHLYGQGAFAKDRRELLKRIKIRLAKEGQSNEFIPEILQEKDDRLSREESAAWTLLDKTEGLTGGERGTFHNLVHVGVCLVRIRRKHVVRRKVSPAV